MCASSWDDAGSSSLSLSIPHRREVPGIGVLVMSGLPLESGEATNGSLSNEPPPRLACAVKPHLAPHVGFSLCWSCQSRCDPRAMIGRPLMTCVFHLCGSSRPCRPSSVDRYHRLWVYLLCQTTLERCFRRAERETYSQLSLIHTSTAAAVLLRHSPPSALRCCGFGGIAVILLAVHGDRLYDRLPVFPARRTTPNRRNKRSAWDGESMAWKK